MKITRDEKKTITIADIPMGDCFKFENVYYIMTDGFIAGSQKSRLCVNLSTGCADFLNVWSGGIPVKAKVVIGEE